MKPTTPIKGLTLNQSIAYLLLREVCGIMESWHRLKNEDIADPAAFIRARYMTAPEAAAVHGTVAGKSFIIPVHDGSGANQVITGIADAALAFYEETGEWASHFAQPYASPSPVPEYQCVSRHPDTAHVASANAGTRRVQLAFIEWLRVRGVAMQMNRTGKWILLNPIAPASAK
jgi:hypothetical protein